MKTIHRWDEAAVGLDRIPRSVRALWLYFLEQAFSWKGVRLEVLDPPEQQEPTEELVEDLLTIVSVFAGRLYRHRARELRKRVQTALKECKEAPETTGQEPAEGTEVTHRTGYTHDETAP